MELNWQYRKSVCCLVSCRPQARRLFVEVQAEVLRALPLTDAAALPAVQALA